MCVCVYHHHHYLFHHQHHDTTQLDRLTRTQMNFALHLEMGMGQREREGGWCKEREGKINGMCEGRKKTEG